MSLPLVRDLIKALGADAFVIGVEFSQEPTEQPYGLDAGFRDQSGNQIRMMQQ